MNNWHFLYLVYIKYIIVHTVILKMSIKEHFCAKNCWIVPWCPLKNRKHSFKMKTASHSSVVITKHFRWLLFSIRFHVFQTGNTEKLQRSCGISKHIKPDAAISSLPCRFTSVYSISLVFSFCLSCILRHVSHASDRSMFGLNCSSVPVVSSCCMRRKPITDVDETTLPPTDRRTTSSRHSQTYKTRLYLLKLCDLNDCLKGIMSVQTRKTFVYLRNTNYYNFYQIWELSDPP